jgi:hypothetical protein
VRAGRRLDALVLAADDEDEPELHDVTDGPDQATEVEELRTAVRPVVMVYRYLRGPKPGVLIVDSGTLVLTAV